MSNRVSKTVALKGDLSDVQFTPDRKQIVVTSKEEVTVLDGTSGEVVTRVTGFQLPTAISFRQQAVLH